MDLYDLTDLPLEEAMIRFAIRPYTVLKYKVFQEKGWKIFKSEYKCNENAAELYAKFWDDIIPNMGNYEIVKNSKFVPESLNRIPNPRKIQPIPTKASANVTVKDAYAMLREEAERITDRRFNDPKLLAFKDFCSDVIEMQLAKHGDVGARLLSGNRERDHRRDRRRYSSSTSVSSCTSLANIYQSPFPSPGGSGDSHDGRQSSNTETRRSRSRSAGSRVDSVEPEDP